jgi:multidrug efflux pump subunit AcrA (membrane-fusion protein)
MEVYEQNKTSAQRGQPAGEGPPRRPGSSRRVALVFLFLLIGFAGLFVYGYRHYVRRQHVVEAAANAAEGALPLVNVERVRRAPATTELLLPGNITPVTEAYIYARASGYVQRRQADIGDRVRAGQLLAEIEAPELDQQVQQARAALAQAEKQLEQAKADLGDVRSRMELARVTWDRYKVLVEHGAVSRQEGDQQIAALRSTSAAVTSVEARIGSAEHNVTASRASLDRLLALQDFEKVRAPFSGVITVRNFDVGALISGSGGSLGQSAGTGPGAISGPSTGTQGGELFRIAQISVLRVLVSVPEVDAPGIRIGQPAVIRLQAFPKRQFEGRVTRTANAVDIGSRTMLTEIQVQNSDLVLLPGMYVQVWLLNTRPEPPLMIAGSSVLATPRGLRVAVLVDLQPQDRPPGPAGQSRTYPPDARRIHLQEIQVGRDYGQEIEVFSGLQGWEHIVLNPGDEIEEGAIVRPSASPKAEGTGGPRRAVETGRDNPPKPGTGSPEGRR